MRCVLVGNYGVGNLGDEALKEYFLRFFPEIQWSVLSAHPEKGEYDRLPAGIRSLLRVWAWPRTFKAYRQADAVVFGGGSLFTDAESVFACVLWWLHAAVAFMYGKPVLMAFQGVGPFQSTLGEKLARRVFRNASFVSVRDEESFLRVKAWKLSTKVVQSSDPVYLLISKLKSDSTKNILVVIPRHNSGTDFDKTVSEAIKKGNYEEMKILLMQPEHAGERAVADRLFPLHPHPSTASALTLPSLTQEVQSASLVVTQRYHGAIAAVALGKKVVICPQKPGDKMDALRLAIGVNAPEFLSKQLQSAKEGERALKTALAKKG